MRARPSRPQTDAGVTLIEVLVVLVLVGVMAGVVGLSMGGDRTSGTAAQQADLLVARLNRAADEVILTGQPFSFVWSQGNYRFVVQDKENWVPHPLPTLSAQHALPAGMRINTSPGAVVLSSDMLPDTGQPLELELVSRRNISALITFDGVNATRKGSSL